MHVEYSDLEAGIPRTFVLLLDGNIVAQASLAGTGSAPEVKNLGSMKLRGGPHSLQVTLVGETLLEASFFYLGQGHLWVGIWDTGAHFGVSYRAPAWM